VADYPPMMAMLLLGVAIGAILIIAVVKFKRSRALFRERTQDLSTALAQQTATGEILRAIVASPADTRPVFGAILQNAAALCKATAGAMFLFDGERLHLVANNSYPAPAREEMERTFPLIPHRGSLASRAVLDRAVVNVPDLLAEPGYDFSHITEIVGVRALVAVPMMRESEPIGVIAVHRAPPGRFSDQEVSMLMNFADQAVVALGHAQLLEDLRVAKEEAEAAALAKASFLATMSHEIRTPMNGVLGFLEVLQLTRLDPKQSELANLVHESASSLLRIIDDILDFSKIDAGRIGIEREPLAPATLVEGVAEALAAQAQRKKLQLTTVVDDAVPAFVEADPIRLRQILFNLIGNAIKFTERGEVGVHVSSSPTPSGGLMLRVDVRDTGIGIAADAREQLFQPFVQADGSITRRFGGTGLGLSISKRLVELMGGEIGVESTPGQGSNFWFTVAAEPSSMPAQGVGNGADPPATTGIEPPDRETALAAGELILVAEDNATNRMVLARQLAQLGYVADVVDNGRQALARFQGTRYGLVITDIHMPGMDGLALTAAIRDLERQNGFRPVPVLALTADVLIGESERYRAAGIDDRIHKPASLSVIHAALSRWLPNAERPAASVMPDLEPPDAPPTDAGAAEILNLEQMRKTLGGVNATAVILLRRYVEHTEPLIADIERACAGRRIDELREAAHSALGASRTAGAEQLAGLLKELQMAVKSQEWSDADALRARLAPAFARVRDAIDRLGPETSELHAGEGR
jgi:signal transduction histidine kinase/DNA-binding NarL/FixJ family response regulator/HPt (histidine-containing phosphotransfer) domain-containing protein